MGLDEMNDSVCESETASCTAITEKRQEHRTGGCTGILFRLFDWNRRFAKKKLFSRKLLTPAAYQAKQAAKKFKGDEKMPMGKLQLIADENKGGFPKLKKNSKGTELVQKQEMRAPCLVARLMGLEFMPAVHRDKNKKPSLGVPRNDRRHESVVVDTSEEGEREGLHLEKGQLKHENRPQKLQKTGLSNRQALTRFAHEGMQFKGVLSRNRKHHHSKLAAPVKSPRVSSARNVSRVSRSRLIDAATKILEPGLVAKNKYRHSLGFPSDATCSAPDKVMLVGSQVCPADRANQSDYNTASAKLFAGHAACRNCGYLLENADLRPNVAARLSECAASTSDFVDAPNHSGVTQQRPSLGPGEQEKKVSCMASQQNSVSLAARLRNDTMEHRVLLQNGISVSQNTQEHRGQSDSNLHDKSPSTALKNGTMKERWLSSAEERMPTLAKVSNFHKKRIASAADYVDGTKGFVGINSRPTGQIDRMVSAVPETSNADAYVAKIGRANSSSQLRTPGQKRRFIEAQCLVENPSFVSSTSRTQRNLEGPLLTGKEKGLVVHCYNDALIERRSQNRAKSVPVNRKNVNCAISLASNSSSTHMGEFFRIPNAADSFSNCRCISSNLIDPSVPRVHQDFANKTYDHPRPFGSGKLNQREGLHRNTVTNLYARTTKDFCNFGVARASRYKLSHAQMVAKDVKLLFPDANSFNTCCEMDFGVIRLLLNKLERSASSSLSSITAFMGSDTENSRNQFREFLLNCLLECLDSRFFCHDKCSPWKKLPLSMDLETWIQDVEGEIRSWAGLSSMSIDEIIEWEMGNFSEKWTNFRNEALENGIAIDGYIFKSLMEELIEDLHGASKLKYSI
ncbi:uncharacterized protein LOC116207584 [Punica granatum]|uniref:Uncharacterized protein LOC116207584 n=2 Tax=Punica granatum TaxID=22663 RepID=A0A6P8DT74_PUNGR|nr:uncharacterized protein LOC116207584 [Punica granatum]XP_031396452.1 uncharacterized protein LOC116207584 [Punica granatum]PKI75636.1 hypothetical protein CRG98_004037 [Punica granatum]